MTQRGSRAGRATPEGPDAASSETGQGASSGRLGEGGTAELTSINLPGISPGSG